MNKTFNDALNALKEGKRVTRNTCMWPTERRFIFRQIPASIPADVVPKMQSLPDTVKNYFAQTFESESEQIDDITYADQLALVSDSNLITSYSPSVSDVLATDWQILD